MEPNQNPEPINQDPLTPAQTPETPVPAPETPTPAPADPAPVDPVPVDPAPLDATPVAPEAPAPPDAGGQPQVMVGSADSAPTAVTASQPTAVGAGKGKSRKTLLIAIIVPLLVIGGAAAFYFGYWMNPSVVLSQGLGNTGNGYTKLVDYFNQQSSKNYKSASGSGSYTFKSGSTSTDGHLAIKSDGANSDMTFDVGIGVGRVNAEVMTIKSAGTNPDIYLKASGISGLGSLTGDPDIDSAIDKLDGQWIAIDHTLLDNIESKVGASSVSKANAVPTNDQITDEVNAFGRVNQQYVFTTNKSKSITVVKKSYGKEKVDGHTAYHYLMGFNDANLKQYITAQHDALNSSKLAAWIKANNYQSDVDSSYNQLEKDAGTVKSSDTFDLWVDASSRLVYKVRISDTTNPASNYADIGLDYKGGSTSYPFFFNFQSDQDGTKGSASMLATLDSKTNAIALKFNYSSGDATFNANISINPSNQAINLTAPSGAESLAQVMDQLGLGDLLNSVTQATPSDSTSSPADNLSIFQ